MVLLTGFRKRAPRARERQSISQGPALTSRVSQSVRQAVITRAHPALTPPPASRSNTSTLYRVHVLAPGRRYPVLNIFIATFASEVILSPGLFLFSITLST